jgi:hypothetical protein
MTSLPYTDKQNGQINSNINQNDIEKLRKLNSEYLNL